MSAYQLISTLIKAALGAIAIGLFVLAMKLPIAGALIFTAVVAALCSFEIRPAGAIGIAESIRLFLFAGVMVLITTPSFYLFNLTLPEAATMAFYLSQLTVAVLATRAKTKCQSPKAHIAKASGATSGQSAKKS